MTTNKTTAGFSLIQLSVLLLVSSIIVASLLPGGDSGSEKAKEQITLSRMAAIEEATRGFMARNLRRPCPASGLAAYNSEEGLYEQCPPANDPPFLSNDVNSYAGTVPTLTLGLPPEMGLDGYGRRMMYVVDSRVVSSNSTSTTAITTCQDMHSLNQTGAIEIAGDYFIPASDNTMWALISYGRDGHGSFRIGGSGLKDRMDLNPTDPATIYNAFVVPDVNAYGTPVDSGVNTTTRIGGRLIQKPATSTFDDIVWYAEETKNTCMLGTSTSSNGFKFSSLGSSESGNTRAIVTASGDINDDGLDDLITAVPSLSTVYVIYGRKNTWPSAASASTSLATRARYVINEYSPGFTITGSGSSGSSLGRAIAVGNVDGDLFDDIIIASDRYIYVIFGEVEKEDLPVDSTSTNNGTKTRTAVIDMGSCPTANTCPGDIAVGDVAGNNSNVFDDIVFSRTRLGATDATTQIYVIVGNSSWPSSGVISTSSLGSNGFAITTDTSNHIAVGYNTISIGNFNNDSKQDILFGGSSSEQAYILFGSTGTSNIALNTAVTNTSTGMRFTDSGTTNLGRTVALRDVDKDGIDDAIIANNTNVYVYYGRSSIPLATVTLSTARNINMTSSNIDAISTTDINNDGLKDLVLGSSSDSSNTGIVYVFPQPVGG